MTSLQEVKMKTITLTEDQWEIILSAVENHWDCGPDDEGWQSQELSSAVAALEAELKK